MIAGVRAVNGDERQSSQIHAAGNAPFGRHLGAGGSGIDVERPIARHAMGLEQGLGGSRGLVGGFHHAHDFAARRAVVTRRQAHFHHGAEPGRCGLRQLDPAFEIAADGCDEWSPRRPGQYPDHRIRGRLEHSHRTDATAVHYRRHAISRPRAADIAQRQDATVIRPQAQSAGLPGRHADHLLGAG